MSRYLVNPLNALMLTALMLTALMLPASAGGQVTGPLGGGSTVPLGRISPSRKRAWISCARPETWETAVHTRAGLTGP